MGNERRLIYNLVLICTLGSAVCTLHGFEFMVGGRDGWVLNPYESYNHWAQRLRFQVNDTLLFKYKKGSDSVVVVNRDDYEKCNTQNPILKLEDGHSIFRFDRSGFYHFISGAKSNCLNGQKLIIVVLAMRNGRSFSPPPPPAPEAPAPAPDGPPSPPPATDGPSDTPTVVNTTVHHPPPPHRSFATAVSVYSVVLVPTVLISYVIVGFFN